MIRFLVAVMVAGLLVACVCMVFYEEKEGGSHLRLKKKRKRNICNYCHGPQKRNKRQREVPTVCTCTCVLAFSFYFTSPALLYTYIHDTDLLITYTHLYTYVHLLGLFIGCAILLIFCQCIWSPPQTSLCRKLQCLFSHRPPLPCTSPR